jgi:LysR family transcriptional regulator of gallate degradation
MPVENCYTGHVSIPVRSDSADRSASAEELESHIGDLLLFVTVAGAESITRAATSLSRATSAVGRSVLELERAVGLPLLERNWRGSRVNAHGQAVVTRGQRLLAQLDRTTGDLIRLGGKDRRLSRQAIHAALADGNRLRLIAAIGDLGSVSAAAARIGLSQGGASMTLGRLREAIGQPLFERTSEGMTPTDSGRAALFCAHRMLAEVRHLKSDLAAVTGSVRGTVAVGSTHLGRTHYFPAAIAAVVLAHPGIRVQTIEAPYGQLVGRLRNGEIDMLFGVLRSGDAGGDIAGERLFTDRMAIFARAGHPMAGKTMAELADLRAGQWILPRAAALGKAQVDAAFVAQGLKPPEPSVETGDLATLRQLLMAGDMLALASPHQLAFELDAGLLTELPIRFDGASLEIGLMMRDSAMLSPAALAIVDAVREQVRQPRQ